MQSMGSDLDKFLIKSVSLAGDTDVSSTDPTHATGMAETILRAMAAQGGSTSAQIYSVDVYGNSETTTSWMVALGIQEAVDGGATVLNLSLSGTSDSAVLDDIIQQAIAKGIIVFAAAGNQPVSSATYPASLSGVNAVTALASAGQLADYANYGSFVDMALPGASVIYYNHQYYVVQGTSPATAYATGVAAGTKSDTTMTWSQILAAMQQKFTVPKK
jgi:hypothetical protein